MASKKSFSLSLSLLLLSSLLFVLSAGFAKDPPKKQLRQCLGQCERVHEQEQTLAWCRQQCQAKFEEDNSQKKEKSEEEDEDNNPYVFEDEHFSTVLKTDLGKVSVLQKFTERSKKLRGIENFRIGVLEASPRTFVLPAHTDADTLIFVTKGRGSVSILKSKKQSFNFECGDIFRIPSGIPVYMTNMDDKEKLIMVQLLEPVSVPGHFQAFSGPGGDNPESFYTAFSWEVLEAAFKTDRESLKKIFRQKERGFIKASREQIEALSASEGHEVWPFGSDPKGPFNLLNKSPTQSNQFGKLFEADSDDYKPLKDLDVVVAFANITKGSMIGPYYNSRATKIAFVVDGEGWSEIAGSPDESKSSSVSLSARLRQGTVFVAPAGHPFVAVASQDQNLQILCFEVNAKDNIRFPLAGKKNVVSLMDKEAKELSFNVPAPEVDKVFGKQEEELFFPGPKKGHGDEYSSM